MKLYDTVQRKITSVRQVPFQKPTELKGKFHFALVATLEARNIRSLFLTQNGL
jgi:hypothetical protein